MATETQTSDLSAQYTTYFSKKLLDRVVQLLRLLDFAQQAELPQKQGSKQIDFFIPPEADSSRVKTLTEGTVYGSSDYVQAVLTKVSVTMAQLGEAAKITDIVSWTDMFNALQQHIDMMALDCALKSDDIARDEVVENVDDAGQRRYAQGTADWATLAAATAANAKIKEEDVLKAVTQLKIQRALTLMDGCYVGVICPQVGYDYLQGVQDVIKYATEVELMKGEVGKWKGCRIVEATNPYIEDANGAQNTYAASGDIFTSVFLGKNAFGVPKLAGVDGAKKNGVKPQIIINNKADKSDPLNQFITAGWKSYWQAKLLREKWVVTMRSKSTFS